ncbi:type I polyketide synthase [Streptomyces sp. PT12]|uniref:type I polyketide synthase n=1 Tax=Streptomyces sp. PT12 TaxID=1510197 RepID=UPI000DE3E996|nr:type I polyketide synthase [Streptomyces sp. PT12]RBM06848.1 beta-ketoacyl synthase [Streptomyces sp. PT12]
MIAVTGLACRFPGAPDAASFWKLLTAGREGLTRFTEAELAASGVPRRLRRHPDYVPVGGLIEGQDLFDPAPFGLADAEAALLDPQQRLFLEVAWQALEQAGHGGGAGAGSVGVFAGAAHSAYLTSNLAGRWSPTGGGADPVGSLQTAIATHADYLPLQVAYRLDLTGPAIALNTTCSTSLVAVHAAAQSLLAEECDTAIAGGVSLIVPQGHGYLRVADGIYSADGSVRPFSATGTGIVYTQGVGAVVLRRLDEALADGDPVLAVLHGSAVNNDGASKAGFTAPSLRGQARVIAEAQAVAGVTSDRVGYVEAHGTATRLGDPVEIAALRRVFGDEGPAWCGLGSVKSNIGHANTAAGIASFIKTTLAVWHGVQPASLHAEPLNELLGLDGSPFEVVKDSRPWRGPELAGVSAFGIGGTNCHVVLGPAPERPTPEPSPRRPVILAVSAHDAAAAEATAAQLGTVADSFEAADLAHTLRAGRPTLPYRVAVAASPGHAGAALAGRRAVRAQPGAPRVVFAFPGAGSQYPGMGAGLYGAEPVFRDAVDECAELLRPLLGADVRAAIRGEGAPPVEDPGYGLPALFAASLGVARLLESWGVRPGVVLGHSLGEYTAAVVAGGLTLPEAARLVAVRCTEAARAARGGTMLAVPLGEAETLRLLAGHPEVDLAAVNAPDACVVSGPCAAVDTLASALAARSVRPTELRVDAALHSRLVEPALPAVRAAAAGLRARPLSVPLVTTVAGDHAGAELGTAEHWVRQLRDPVRFADALRTALPPEQPALLVQVGPGAALASLARRTAPPALRATLTTCVEDEPDAATTIRETVAQLWAHGVDIDLALGDATPRRRVAAPGYAFQRRRLWIDPPAAATDLPGEPEPDGDEPLHLPRWRQLPPADAADSPAGRWLVVAGEDRPLADAVRRELTARGAECVAVAEQGEALDGVVLLATDQTDDLAAAVLRHTELAARLDRLAAPPRLLLQVTEGAVRVEGDDRPEPVAGAVRTLPRVLAQELRGLAWRTLDLPTVKAGNASERARFVMAELGELTGPDAAPGREVAVRGGVRWARDLVPWRPARTREAPPATGTVLITGGLGDVGLAIADHLGRAGRRVVLTSRTGGRAEGVRRLATAGRSVEVRTLDAADAAGTAALVRELAADGGLGLVVHAAGAVATAGATTLRETTPEQVRAHVAAKADGALALRAAVDALPAELRPSTVVLMSSATTLVGGIGMGAYAAANGFLDALADAAQPGPTRWISAVWDGWRVGPAGGERTVALAGALDAETGLAALDRLLAGPTPPVVAVATTSLADRMARAAAPADRPSTGPGGSDPGEPTARWLAELWAGLFGTPALSADADFFALGGHSLLATRMLAAVRERFGTDLRLRDLLDAPTVGALAARVDAAVPEAPARPPADLPQPAAADGTFPLTRVQHAYWVGRDGGYEWGEVPCHFYLEYDCERLDVARYERAWNLVLARHPMLRAVVTPTGRVRVLDDVPPYRVRVHDLTTLPEERRSQRLARLRERISREPGPADRWPLAQIQAALLPGGRVRLFVGVDVLVCDAASWWIIDRELRRFYHAPDEQLPPLKVDFASCVAAVEERRRGPAGQRAAAYWRERLDTLPGPPPLPVAEPVGPARFVRRAARLEAGAWAALRAEATRHRVTPTAALLAAYAETLAAWSGDDRFSLVLTLFDRPDTHPDVAGVVGDFTSLVPHVVERARAGSFVERARAAQATLFADLDHREFSALEVLAEKSTRVGRRVSVPVVFTSALGLPDVIGADHDPEWVGEQVAALSQTPQTWLDHQALEQGGRLLLQWDALEPVLPPEEVDRAFADYVRRVERLATDPAAWAPEAATPDGTDVSDEDIAVPVRPGHDGGPTLFLTHPSGGDIVCYAELARLLDPRVEVVALTDPELAGGTGAEDIDGMVRRFLDVVRRRRPHGPYLLGGWSMGGDLAHEMARRLHQEGETTALLALLDSNDPVHITPVDRPSQNETELEVVWRFLGALEAFTGAALGGGRDRAASETITAVRNLPDAARWREIDERLRAAGLLGRRDSARRRVAVFARHLRALADHRPTRLEAPATRTLLIRADRPAPRNAGIGMGVDDTPPGVADLGWGRHLAGPLDVVGVPAHHYSLLRPPALPRVAEALNDALRRAIGPA